MKLTVFFLVLGLLQVAAKSNAQIHLKENKTPLEKVLKSIKKQSGYDLLFSERLVKTKGQPVTIQLNNVPLEEALKEVFKGQDQLSFSINGKIIGVKEKNEKKATPVTEDLSPRLVSPPSPPAIDLRGIVVNEKGEPVEGATVAVKGTDKKTSTNAKGEFSISSVNEKLTLIVSAVTIETKEVSVNGQMFVKVEVSVKVNDLDETVVVAYNTTTKRSNVAAVSVVKGEEILTLPATSLDKRLQGLVPGLLVTSGSGQPGSGLSNFILRGIGTSGNAFNGSTVRNPLIVVDGVPVSQDPQQLRNGNEYDVSTHNPMAQLNPSDIETISVLKDAAAIALYGSKASNGVILITTKQGQMGKNKINFRHQTNIAQRLPELVELVNESEYMELLIESYKNVYPTATTDSIVGLLKGLFPTRSDGSFYPFQPMADQVYSNAAIGTTNELSMSGGSGRITYYTSFGWNKQVGTYRNTGHDRKSIQLNLKSNVTNWLKIGFNNTLSYSQQDYSAIERSTSTGIVNTSAPLMPVYLENGDLILNYTIPFDVNNPIAAMRYNKSQNNSYRALSRLSVEATFFKYFQFSSLLGVDFQLTESKERRDPRLYDYVTRTVGQGRIEEGALRSFNLISTNKFSFARTFGNNHSVNMLIAQEAQVQQQKNLITRGTGIRFISNDQIDNTATRTSNGNSNKQTLLSYFGQANYSFRNKYFISASIRSDGSSKFGSDQRMGTYWSTGLGWIASSEKFMAPVQNWLSYLKLRGSFGTSGNSGPIDRYTKYTQLTAANYLNSGNIAVYPSSIYNPDIKWEETFSWDAGIEARFLKDRIGFNIDMYKRKTFNLIYLISIPNFSGFSSLNDNIGDMENKGLEIALNATVLSSKNFSWNIRANWSTNENKLIKSNVKFAQVGSSALANEVGRNFNSFYYPVWAGVNPVTGVGQWIDSTGKPTSNYRAATKQFVGKPQPDGFGSFSHSLTYKNFQLTASFYYQYGFQAAIAGDFVNDGSNPYSLQAKSALNRWQKPGDIAPSPKRTLNNQDAFRESTRRLYDAAFIRFQNLSLTYTLPVTIARKLYASSINMFLQADNLAIWTKAEGNDLSDTNLIGQTGGGYPNSRTYSFGINVNF